jgi:hypothetical protein
VIVFKDLNRDLPVVDGLMLTSALTADVAVLRAMQRRSLQYSGAVARESIRLRFEIRLLHFVGHRGWSGSC